jgi:hypothetical protein
MVGRFWWDEGLLAAGFPVSTLSIRRGGSKGWGTEILPG